MVNALTRLIGTRHPIIQAPMAGGVTTAELVCAVSNAGALGSIGAGYMQAEALQQLIQEIKKNTNRPYNVNLFVPTPYTLDEDTVTNAQRLLQPFQTELDLSKVERPTSFDLPSFHEQIDIIIDEQVPICSFTFGIPSDEVMTRLKEHGILLIGTATTVEEAIENEKRGLDAIVIQGAEAGGHRGAFLVKDDQSLIGLMSLLPQVADHVSVPIIAAGGIMDHRGILAASCLGASGVQMGTAFLVCQESGAHLVHKRAILSAKEDDIVLTRAFSGKTARGIANTFTKNLQAYEDLLPSFPVQNGLTGAIRKAAATNNNPEYMSLWSGHSPRLAKQQTVAELIESLILNVEATNL